MPPVWLLLAALAIALAWPVPILLARAAWPARSPGLALALWQAIALSGGLSMIGALLTYGLLPFGSSLPAAVAELGGVLVRGPLPADVGVLSIAALAGAVGLGAHLLLNLVTTAIRTERQRRRHRALVDLLSSPVEGRPGTRVLDYPAPVAYCLPGVRNVTVLSEGLLRVLDEEQLRAVLAHERAHLRQFHHLVLLAFKAWHGALPWFPITNRAERAVALLVEMLADDDARRATDDETLATAIATVGSAWDTDPSGEADGPSTGPGVADAPGALGARVSRLLSPSAALAPGARILVVAAGLGLVAIPVASLATLV